MSDNGNKITEPKLSWDLGTAYDLFVSLEVLHRPSTFGLRAAWAAGMRSRLPLAERETLEQFQKGKLLGTPLHWVHGLPEPKDGATALKVLSEMAPADRIEAMALSPRIPDEFKAVIQDAGDKGAWEDSYLEELVTSAKEMHKGENISVEAFEILLDWWVDRDAAGERLLTALRAYYEGFFAEEENRIRPAMREGLKRAQELHHHRRRPGGAQPNSGSLLLGISPIDLRSYR
jgi:hypothetical protein